MLVTRINTGLAEGNVVEPSRDQVRSARPAGKRGASREELRSHRPDLDLAAARISFGGA
jgi:hypothetical protein